MKQTAEETFTKRLKVTVKEELDETEQKADIYNSVKIEKYEENFQEEDSIVSKNSNNDEATNDISQVTVKLELDETEQKADIYHSVKIEKYEENFKVEERVSPTSNEAESTNDISQVTVKEEKDEDEESADTNHFIKAEIDETVQVEESMVSTNDSHNVMKGMSNVENTDTNIKDIINNFQTAESISPKNTDITPTHYDCDNCATKCKNKESLISHMKRHMTIKLFPCNKCDKVFIQKSNLHQHMKTHEELPHSCNKYTESVISHSNLKRHMKTRRTERRLKCAKCHITPREDVNLRFHRFPLPGKHCAIKARVWAEYCFPDGNWTTEKSLKSLHQQHVMLCSKHFSVCEYTNSSRKRLNNFAIPTGAQDIMFRLRQEQSGMNLF